MPNSSVWRNTSNLFQNQEVVSHSCHGRFYSSPPVPEQGMVISFPSWFHHNYPIHIFILSLDASCNTMQPSTMAAVQLLCFSDSKDVAGLLRLQQLGYLLLSAPNRLVVFFLKVNGGRRSPPDFIYMMALKWPIMDCYNVRFIHHHSGSDVEPRMRYWKLLVYCHIKEMTPLVSNMLFLFLERYCFADTARLIVNVSCLWIIMRQVFSF
jgi:hypothetical protein